jgi:hypothetical protein
MPRYTPTVTVNGRGILPTWDGTNLVALDGITLNWGRAGLFDQTGPSTTTVQIIDSDGAWGSDPARYGEKLTITLDSGRTIFRGWVDEVSLSRRTVVPAGSERAIPVWIVTLKASDYVALLQKAAPAAPYNQYSDPSNRPTKAYYESKFGVGWWDYATRGNRRAMFVTAMELAGIDAGFVTITSPQDWWMIDQPAGVSLYTLIAQYYAHAGAHVNYDAATNSVAPGTIAPATGARLVLDGATVRVLATGTGRTIDASTVIADKNADIVSSVAHNIAAIRIHTAWYPYLIPNEDFQVGGQTYTFPQPPAERDLEIQVAPNPASPLAAHNVFDVPFYSQTLNPDNSADTSASADVYVSTVWAGIIKAVNGKFTAPPATFDFERWDYGPDVEAILLDTKDHPVSLRFPGSIYDGLTGYGPAFQLIGGTLVYQQGWQLRSAVLAPAPVTDANLTLADLSKNDTATLADCADTLRVGTLATITEGLPA